jgi:TetR/AcrR family transcriptional repressor of mexJK operon
MDDIAALAGLSKRTLYNNYADKGELFTQIVADVVARAEEFAEGLPAAFEDLTRTDLSRALHDLGARLALGILRPEVIALRRLLIGEARSFPDLAADYFDRAPGRVMEMLASAFGQLMRAGVLRTADARRAAEQFAYLVAGASLDRAILLGAVPTGEQIVACARDGVETFLARYRAGPLTDLD